MKVGTDALVLPISLPEETSMSCDARAGFDGRICIVAFTLCLVFGAESTAQPGQWMLGVRTETISETQMLAGDPPGVRRQRPNTTTVYMLRVSDVIDGSAADKAGLKRGDVIESVNDKSVRTHNDLIRIVRGSNGVVELDLKTRNGRKTKKIDLRAGGGEPPAAGEIFVQHIGIYYEKVANQDGTFVARLTRDAVAGSPTTQIRVATSPQLLRLEKGDAIIASKTIGWRRRYGSSTAGPAKPWTAR
jgi:membrane-associated protease RseP (regulator of RpoE activity)